MTTPAEAIAKLQAMDPNEPVFVLRSQDVIASGLVREWCVRATVLRAPRPKVTEAYECAEAMDAWGTLHPTKIPD